MKRHFSVELFLVLMLLHITQYTSSSTELHYIHTYIRARARAHAQIHRIFWKTI